MSFKPTRPTKKSGMTSPKISKGKAQPDKKEAKISEPKTTVPLQAQKKFINVYLSLGSNIAPRMENLRQALSLIHHNIGKIARESSVYETQPWGKSNQESFLNMVVMINTSKQPREILDEIAKIERELGRQRTEKWGPRTVDIDILFYGKRIIRDKGLEIPHPLLHQRAFVLVPMLEIAPEFEHPTLKRPIDQLYMDCEDLSEVVQLSEPIR